MTKAIGHGTRNLALNFPDAYLALIRRAAFVRGQSIKEYLDRRFLRGLALEDKAMAQELVRIKRERRRTIGSATLLLLFVALHIWGHDADIRKASRRTRVERRERTEEV